MNLIKLGNEAAELCLLTPVCGYDKADFETLYRLISGDVKRGFLLCGFEIMAPNACLSPWRAEKVFAGGDDFGCGAAQTLSEIENAVLPCLGARQYIIGGYSLSGLFSLWCGYESDSFAAVNACSPSVWFEGWDEYAENRRFNPRFAYLSIGDREHITKNQAFARSKGRIIQQHECLVRDLGPENAVLVYERGSHFSDPAARTARGFARCVNTLCG